MIMGQCELIWKVGSSKLVGDLLKTEMCGWKEKMAKSNTAKSVIMYVVRKGVVMNEHAMTFVDDSNTFKGE